MSDFKERLEKEATDLLDKTTKLGSFLASDKVDDIDPVQHDLLKIQYTSMLTYYRCLTIRLERL